MRHLILPMADTTQIRMRLPWRHLAGLAAPAQMGVEVPDGGVVAVAVTVAMYSIVRTETRLPQTRRGPRY